MAIDPDHSNVVREALDASDSVDARGIEVAVDRDMLVLRGSVATFEEASAALTIAEQHADEVRNELRVDVNLREGTSGEDSDGGRRDAALQGSSFDPAQEPDDLVDDMQESLSENVPWDPPHEAVEVPTRAESRGRGDHSADEDDTLLEERAGEKSLPDVTPEELGRAAHPQPRDEENV